MNLQADFLPVCHCIRAAARTTCLCLLSCVGLCEDCVPFCACVCVCRSCPYPMHVEGHGAHPCPSPVPSPSLSPLHPCPLSILVPSPSLSPLHPCPCPSKCLFPAPFLHHAGSRKPKPMQSMQGVTAIQVGGRPLCLSLSTQVRLGRGA